MPRSPPTIRARLVALGLAMVLPLVAVSAGWAVLVWRSSQAEARRDLLVRAQALGAVVEQELETARATLQTLALSSRLETGDLEGFHRLLTRVPHPEGVCFVLFDPSGRMLVNSDLPFGAKLPPRDDGGVAGGVLASGGIRISGLCAGAGAASDTGLTIVVPVMRNGRMVYALGTDLRPANPGRVLEWLGLPGSAWIATFPDGRNLIVARTPDMDKFMGRAPPAEAWRALSQGAANGAIASSFLHGEPALTAFSRLPGSNWGVIVTTARAAVDAKPWNVRLAAVASGSALLLTGLLVALYQAHRIAISVRDLAGGPAVAARSGVWEVEEVARALAAVEAERMQAEAELRESEARFRGTFDQAAVGVAHVALDGRWLRVNGRLCAMLGYSEAELLKMTFQDVTYPEDLGPDLENMRRLLAGEICTYSLEKRYIRKGGALLWCNLTVSLMRDDAGRPRNFISIVEDISARKAAEATLAESEARFRAITDAMPQVVWSARPDGFVDYANQRWYERTGMAQELTLGHGWPIALHPDDRASAMARWRHSVATGEPYEVEFRLCQAGGGYRWNLCRALPVRDPETGAVTRWFGTCTDIEETVAAREALARSRGDLERLVAERTRDLEATQARLAQAQRMEALGQLAGGIAHDFNNVLQAVQGGGALIERRPGDTEGVRRLARMILEAAGRGAAITRRLLAFSRQGDLRAEPIDAGILLAGMQEILVHTLGAGIEVRREAPAGLPSLLADKGQLETVLVNLATNARDAMQGGGILTLSAAAETVPHDDPGHPGSLRAGEYVRLSVSDTGIGMDAATLARASEPFFTTKPVGQGTGLGLAMARGFAEQSGGGLHIESAPGHGTVVRLWFPVAAEGRSVTAALSDTMGASGHGGERSRLLLVDDDGNVREVLSEQLEAAGYAVLPADSPSTALALLDAGEPVDLIVSDLSMPGMDGIGLIREAQRRRPELPAILLTGFATNAAEIAVGGAISGAFSLLRKPVEGALLVERVSAILKGAGAPSPAAKA